MSKLADWFVSKYKDGEYKIPALGEINSLDSSFYIKFKIDHDNMHYYYAVPKSKGKDFMAIASAEFGIDGQHFEIWRII